MDFQQPHFDQSANQKKKINHISFYTPHPFFKSNLTLQIHYAKIMLKKFLPYYQIWPIVTSHITHELIGDPQPMYNIQNDM